MASTVDNTSSLRSAQVIPKISPSSSHVVCGEHEQGGDGDAAVAATFPYSPLTSPMSSKALSGRSPLNSSVETKSPRSSAGSEHGGSGNAADTFPTSRGKKPAWKIPSNRAIEVGSVMDAVSWPALTESAKASPKSPSSEFLKALSDGSVSGPQGSSVLSPSKKSPNNQNHNATQNSSASRDQSVKRGLVSDCSSSSNSFSGSSDVGLPLPSSSPKESSQSVYSKQPSLENSPRGPPIQSSGNNDNDRDHKAGKMFQPHAGNGHHRGYGGGRRGNSSNHNSRRDGERGGYDWNHRNFVRDVHMQQLHQHRGVRPYLRPSSVAAAPFITPPPLRPFSNQMGFPDFPSPIYYVAAPSHPESLRGVPFAPHLAHAPQMMLFPASDPQRAMLLKQIDYYFSPDNLCKDLFLRQNMDEQGWVPISVIADFNRVKQMTNSIQYLIDTVQLSSVVEVQGDKIRKRNDWMVWVLRPAEDFESFEAHFDNLYLDLEAPSNTGLRGSTKNDATYSRSASMNLNSQLSARNLEDDDGQVGNYSDRVWNMRTLVRNDTM
ncbi:hypothetical protein KSP40_PGU007283 [Platanthera guangdongensis]|uniref:HTH La-type RNA-binding domain-containing protein n=1 Tax=Platanthera guangdongensis TaxID=2320717 RepID=A0ABR2M5A8_9ASPA